MSKIQIQNKNLQTQEANNKGITTATVKELTANALFDRMTFFFRLSLN